MSLVQSAKELIERAAEASRRQPFIVGVSGKDSYAVLDLVVSTVGVDRVRCYNFYLVPDLDCTRQPLEYASRRFGVEIHSFPYPTLTEFFRRGVYQSGTRAISPVKQALAEKVIRRRLGGDFFAYGHRMHDSLARRGMLKPLQGYDGKTHRIYPIWDWSQRDVIAYLRSRSIMLPERTGDSTMTGVELRVKSLRYIREHYPRDYERIKEVFPHVEAIFVRDDIRQRRKAAASALQHSDGSPQRAD